MITLLVILWVIMAIGLVFVVAIRPRRAPHSWFELERRANTVVLRREALLSDIVALRRFTAAILVIGLSSLGVSLWQWWGLVAVIVVAISAVQLSRIPLIYKNSNRLYKNYESKLLNTVEKFPIIGTLVGADRSIVPDQRLESTEQLMHLVESAGHILTNEQQNIIVRGIDWHSTAVSSVMTQREDIVSVRHSELLGPLVLHDLHESGHTVFPVIKKDLDHIIGIVDIVELLQVDKMKSSHTAEKAMISGVITVTKDTLLPDALVLLVSSRQALLIVIDADETTVGMVTLNDVLGALLGKNRGEVVK